MEEENVKREASYGTIRLSRAQIGGGGQFFFGSKVRVTNSILIEINNAEEERFNRKMNELSL